MRPAIVERLSHFVRHFCGILAPNENGTCRCALPGSPRRRSGIRDRRPRGLREGEAHAATWDASRAARDEVPSPGARAARRRHAEEDHEAAERECERSLCRSLRRRLDRPVQRVLGLRRRRAREPRQHQLAERVLPSAALVALRPGRGGTGWLRKRLPRRCVAPSSPPETRRRRARRCPRIRSPRGRPRRCPRATRAGRSRPSSGRCPG